MSESGLKFEIIRVGNKAYIKGSDAFLRKFAGAAGAQLLHGKWLQGSATSGDLAALAPLTDITKLFNGALGSHGKLENEGETTFKGQKVVAIKDTTEGGTLYVAATGTPYPVAIVGGKDKGTITFDNWNDTVSITAPKGAVDMSKLGGTRLGRQSTARRDDARHADAVGRARLGLDVAEQHDAPLRGRASPARAERPRGGRAARGASAAGAAPLRRRRP